VSKFEGEWVLSQFEKLLHMQPKLMHRVLDKIIDADEELRWSMVVGAYLDKEINLGKAAELLSIHRLELQNRFIEQGIPLRLGAETFEEDKAEVEAWATWMKRP
jgi:predicted HTH domain antitoxin